MGDKNYKPLDGKYIVTVHDNAWQRKCCANCEYSWVDFDDHEDGYCCHYNPGWIKFSGNSCEHFQKSRFLRMVENGILTKENMQ